MRCRKCDYRLWNLHSRVCPECGEPFLPHEYTFVASSVRFCCPHCNQDYYGTDERGHLAPREFTCVGCHTSVTMDEMILLPTEGLEEQQTRREELPWLIRGERGFLRAWLRTIGWALMAPGRLVASMPQTSAVPQAWWFAAVTSFAVSIAVGLMFAPLMVFPMLASAGRLPVWGALVAIGWVVTTLFLGALVLIALWGLATHGILRLVGRTEGGLGRTYEALCYSSGANVAMAVPCAGLYFGWIWWLVSAILHVKHRQRVSGMRASLAVLAFPLLSGTVGVSLNIWFMATVISSSMAVTSASMTTGYGYAGRFSMAEFTVSGETTTMAGLIASYADRHQGQGPRHAAQLFQPGAGAATASLFTCADSNTDPLRIRVGNAILGRIDGMEDAIVQRAVDSAAADLPEGVIAHRLGDFVFTYHGMDLAHAEGSLWIVICSVDPSFHAIPSQAHPACVGRADGTVRVIPSANWARALARQNKLRAGVGLAPLPDPWTITHDRPAVAAAPIPEDPSDNDRDEAAEDTPSGGAVEDAGRDDGAAAPDGAG